MISLEGLTLDDRPHRRSGRHPADLRPLRSRRPDPQPVSRRRTRKGSTTRPTRRCGSSTPSIATSRSPATGRPLQLLLPKLRRHRRPPFAGHAVRHRRRSGGWPAAARRTEGYQLTWMDAKVDDWVVTPRRGKAVEINALWYNALRLLGDWHAARRRTTAARDLASACRAGARIVQPPFLVRSRRTISTTSSTASRATTPRAGPTRFLPFRSRIRCSTARAGTRCSTCVSERLLTPVGLRSLAPGASRLQAEVLRRSARARRRLSPGHGLGLADRPLHRRLAQRSSGRSQAGAALSRRVPAASRRSLHRLDQRNLRRRRALHAARLRRPGLERRRSAALLGQDGHEEGGRARGLALAAHGASVPDCRIRRIPDSLLLFLLVLILVIVVFVVVLVVEVLVVFVFQLVATLRRPHPKPRYRPRAARARPPTGRAVPARLS